MKVTPIVVNNILVYKIVDTYTDPDKFGNVKSMSIEVPKGNKQYDMLFHVSLKNMIFYYQPSRE